MATLKQLKTFITVAECGKMNEAAKQLYVSQPTVSQIISDLESEYHVRLFERTARNLKITPAGQLLLSNAREIVAIHDHLDQAMQNIHARRSLRAGATLTIGNTLMASIVEKLNHDFPDIDVTVLVDNTRIIEEQLIHNELDIALVEGIIVRPEILTRPVLDDSLCLICGNNHPFAKKNSVTMEDLTHQDFIMREKGSGTRAIFENIMLTHHIPFTTKWECSSRAAIVDAVRHNLGLAVLSERCVRDYVESGDIVVCPLEGVSMKRYFYLCHNQGRPMTSQMKDFSALITEMSDLLSLETQRCN